MIILRIFRALVYSCHPFMFPFLSMTIHKSPFYEGQKIKIKTKIAWFEDGVLLIRDIRRKLGKKQHKNESHKQYEYNSSYIKKSLKDCLEPNIFSA